MWKRLQTWITYGSLEHIGRTDASWYSCHVGTFVLAFLVPYANRLSAVSNYRVATRVAAGLSSWLGNTSRLVYCGLGLSSLSLSLFLSLVEAMVLILCSNTFSTPVRKTLNGGRVDTFHAFILVANHAEPLNETAFIPTVGYLILSILITPSKGSCGYQWLTIG